MSSAGTLRSSVASSASSAEVQTNVSGSVSSTSTLSVAETVPGWSAISSCTTCNSNPAASNCFRSSSSASRTSSFDALSLSSSSARVRLPSASASMLSADMSMWILARPKSPNGRSSSRTVVRPDKASSSIEAVEVNEMGPMLSWPQLEGIVISSIVNDASPT